MREKILGIYFIMSTILLLVGLSLIFANWDANILEILIQKTIGIVIMIIGFLIYRKHFK
tara:strand:+ start:162 stop:338 length:177 start_codon:yes stop_codon:yes gene_type:complete